MNQEIRSVPAATGFTRFVLAAVGYVVSAAVGLFVGALLTVLLVSAVAGVSPGSLLRGDVARTGQKVTIDSKSISADAVTAVVKKLGPSVVNVRTTETITDMFHQGTQAEAQGSGIIFRSDGYIITNDHVVENANQIFVTIGGEDLKATVVGTDKDTDLAVIKVDKTGLNAAEFADSSKLQVGQLAVAIGSPFGFESSVTSGVISALHRNVTAGDTGQQAATYTDLIQTDAAINPGNSGGALAEQDGKVIGVNSLIFSPSGASAGLGFAIPSNSAKEVATQLIESGKVSHPYMGILGQTVDKDLAEQLNLPVEKGAILQQVINGGPADKAGLQRRDIIIKFGDVTIETMDDLVAAIRKRNVGDTVTVTYRRDKDEKTTDVTLTEKPAQQ